MNKGYINIIILLFIFILIFVFSIFLIYSHYTLVIYNIRNDLFYFVQNSILNFSEEELGLKNYIYNQEKMICDLQYLIDKHYNGDISKNIIKKAEIKELKFLDKNTNCKNSKNIINDDKIHFIVEFTIKPPIFKKILKEKKIDIHEDVKFSLMEI